MERRAADSAPSSSGGRTQAASRSIFASLGLELEALAPKALRPPPKVSERPHRPLHFLHSVTSYTFYRGSGWLVSLTTVRIGRHAVQDCFDPGEYGLSGKQEVSLVVGGGSGERRMSSVVPRPAHYILLSMNTEYYNSVLLKFIEEDR